jgi:uncharacterized protein (DUF885 family)
MVSMPMRTLAAASLAALVAGALTSAAPPDPVVRLHDLFAREWEFRLREDPLLATQVGVHDHDHRLPSVGLADQERRARAWQAYARELEAIDREALPALERTNYDMFARQLADRVADWELGEHLFPFNADSGFHTEIARLPQAMSPRTLRDHESYLARLRALPRYFAENLELLRAGLERGMTQPAVVLRGIETSIAPHVVPDPEASVFWAPFARLPETLPAADRERLRAAGRAAIRDAVVPAYRELLEFMTGIYVPGARATVGAGDLPGGAAYYRHRIRYFTTLDLEPEEIHRIGLDEVRRIRAEMETVIRRTGFSGDFAAFLHFLRTDPRFYPKSAEELLERAAWIAKRMDGKLPALFKTLPRLPYGVAPVPDHIAPKYTAGRYVDAPVGSTEPGWYWVNTYALESRALYNLEALTLHEAVPGHHLQIALSQELAGLPPFRRYSYLSAFGEGWGLYSEWLGKEAGFYTDPYSDFGRLTYEMWRACRLVVDTGLHAKSWSRQQAIDFLAQNTALPLHEVETETDRYISWPGQALAYKLGELEIKRLRRRAERELGARFDVREFHDAVLLQGSVPLPVLAQAVDGYIRANLRD